jgi:hypothetical protein
MNYCGLGLRTAFSGSLLCDLLALSGSGVDCDARLFWLSCLRLPGLRKNHQNLIFFVAPPGACDIFDLRMRPEG